MRYAGCSSLCGKEQELEYAWATPSSALVSMDLSANKDVNEGVEGCVDLKGNCRLFFMVID